MCIEEIEIDIPIDVLGRILNVETDDLNVYKDPINDALFKKLIEIIPG
jgi:hypothetical protein